MDTYIITVKNLKTNEIRIPIDNGRLADTIPRDYYDFSSEEFIVKYIDKITKKDDQKEIFYNIPDYIETAGHIINVKSTIYSKANSSDIVNGWNLLNTKIDITKLFQLFFILEIRELNQFYKEMTNKGSAIKGAESIIVMWVRLLYWYFRWSIIPSFKEKENDVHDKLRLSNELLEKAKESGIDIEKVKQAFRQINTTISELMIIGLIHDTNSNVISFKKNHEFLIANKIAEVKTITPELENISPIQNINCTNLEEVKSCLFNYICNPNIKINHLKKGDRRSKCRCYFFKFNIFL